MSVRSLLAASALLLATTAAAQSTSGPRPTFGISGGVAFPTGDFGDGYDSGFNLSAHVGFRPSSTPVGFRIEGMYNRFDFKGSSALDIHSNIIAGTGNVVFSRTAAPGSVSPYFIGGAGLYNLKVDSDIGSSDSETKFGLNAGAGLDIPLSGIGVFIEARYHYVFTDGSKLAFIPLVVGVRF